MGDVTITSTAEERKLEAYAALGNAYFGASDAREFASWFASGGSADTDLDPDLETLRARSRDLDRNSGMGHSGIRTWLDSSIGTGLRLSAKPDWRVLNRSQDWANEFADAAEAYWRPWANTTECDASRRFQFGSKTRTVTNSVLLNGEALVIPVWDPQPNSKYATRLMEIESDRLSNPDGQADTDRLRNGVELNELGRPIAYHIKDTHPGDNSFNWRANTYKWTRVPTTWPWGRPRVLHIFDPERAEQHRGRPLLSPGIGHNRMLEKYQQIEVQAALVNSMIAAMVETELPSDVLTEIFGGGMGSDQAEQYFKMRSEFNAPLKSAAIMNLPLGTKLSSFTPNRPGDQFKPFMDTMTKYFGAGIGLPKELLLKDFSESTYSAARAATIEAFRGFFNLRSVITNQFCLPCYAMVLEEGFNNKSLDAPDFYDNRYGYTRANFLPPPRGWVDPLKEAQGAVLRIASNLSTEEQENAEQGLDWQETQDQRVREKARDKQLHEDAGLPWPDPREVPTINDGSEVPV